jgi:hypothetical protein
MLRLFPDYDRDDLVSRLFRKAVAHQWSPDDLDWDAPRGLTPEQMRALTNLLTPVYLGEQAAMNGAARVLPDLIGHGETAAQLYLATFLLDEARHFDVLTRLYRDFGERPLALRRIPEMLRYHHRLMQGDRVDWLWGILISDVFARDFYLAFARVQREALFGRMSARILQDESRHQAFAHTYLKNAVPQLSPARRQALVDMKDDLLETMAAMNRRLRADCEVLGIDGDAFLRTLAAQVEAHAAAFGLGGGGGGGNGDASAWPKNVARLEAGAAKDGVAWPQRSLPASSAPLGQSMAARDVPALTAGDLRLLVGHRPRRVFPAAVAPGGEEPGCADCAVAALCRTLRHAATALRRRAAPA